MEILETTTKAFKCSLQFPNETKRRLVEIAKAVMVSALAERIAAEEIAGQKPKRDEYFGDDEYFAALSKYRRNVARIHSEIKPNFTKTSNSDGIFTLEAEVKVVRLSDKALESLVLQ